MMASHAEPCTGSIAAPGRCLYLYGIVDRPAHPDGAVHAGTGPGLAATGVGRVAAVHSEIDLNELDQLAPEVREGSRLAELARNHDEVVTALTLAGTVLPFRLGTLVPDRQVLARLLEDAQAGLAAALDRVRGHAEWQLRVSVPVPLEPPNPRPERGPGAGTAYLLGKRAVRQRAAEEQDAVRAAAEALDEVLSLAADDAIGSRLDASGARCYLVAKSDQQAFATAAEEGIAALTALGCLVRFRGPLPPYSFADVQLGGARA